MSLWRLRSGQHGLNFIVGTDDDDENTRAAVDILSTEIPDGISCVSGPRPIARGEVENRSLAAARLTDPDLVTMLTDRTFCITPGWDEALARGVTEQPKRVLWWSCPDDPVCVMPVIPKVWLEACDWRWSPEIFPFWFDDTWNQQIDLMLHGLPSLKIQTSYAGVRAQTNRARDFKFWIDLFHYTFPQRARQAKEMAEKLGVEWVMRDDAAAYFQRHHDSLINGIPNMERMFGDPGEPTPEYIEAKKRAEPMLEALLAKHEPKVEEAA